MNREHFRENYLACQSNKCTHYGTNSKGELGCLLLPGCPCNLIKHLLKGGGCVDQDNPQFASSDDYQSSDDANPQ